jgi:hypothetical protein
MIDLKANAEKNKYILLSFHRNAGMNLDINAAK